MNIDIHSCCPKHPRLRIIAKCETLWILHTLVPSAIWYTYIHSILLLFIVLVVLLRNLIWFIPRYLQTCSNLWMTKCFYLEIKALLQNPQCSFRSTLCTCFVWISQSLHPLKVFILLSFEESSTSPRASNDGPHEDL